MFHFIVRYTSLIIVMALVSLLLVRCGDSTETKQELPEFVEISGRTMGTSFTVKHEKLPLVDMRDSVDMLFDNLNSVLSTYIAGSTISRFNVDGKLSIPVDRDGRATNYFDKFFLDNLYGSIRMYSESEGMFDPTVGPLVNLWGFGWKGRSEVLPDSQAVKETMKSVGMDKLEIENRRGNLELTALQPGVQLDFSAIAKGYAVDQLGVYLEANGLYNYFIDIGGEIRARGMSPRGGKWVIGINEPNPEASPEAIRKRVGIDEHSMATSGNYRNFRIVDGQRAWHTLNPKTGYPELNNLLSVSVIHEQCAKADALATSCMVMGLKGAIDLIESTRGAAAYFVYMGDDGIEEYMTSGFEAFVIQ